MLGRLVIAVFALLIVSGPAIAQPRPVLRGELRFYEENDFFNFVTERTDRFYTQGLRVENLYASAESATHILPGVPFDALCIACGRSTRNRALNTGWAIGQNIYTPSDITIPGPQPDERPWAGLLYVSRIARFTRQYPRDNLERQDRIELSIGMVGSASLAGPAQTLWHQIIEDDLPRGWHNQLRNEPIVQLRYETALRRPVGRHVDFIPRVRANLGIAQISMEAELVGRIGWNLAGFGAIINPTSVPFAAAPTLDDASALAGRPMVSGNLFARAGIKAVAHNIFLDGNILSDNDIRIDRRFFVPEYAVGIELTFFDRFRVSFQFVRRGSEFRDSLGRAAPALEFGSINLVFFGPQRR